MDNERMRAEVRPGLIWYLQRNGGHPLGGDRDNRAERRFQAAKARSIGRRVLRLRRAIRAIDVLESMHGSVPLATYRLRRRLVAIHDRMTRPA